MNSKGDKIHHEGWNQEGSLTSPEDRDMVNKWRPNQSGRSLTEDEVKAALAQNIHKDYMTMDFFKTERQFRDPPIRGQDYTLISFTPAKGATPNENDIYGFIKVRGNFSNDIEIDERCEYLIRNVDSYNNIQVGPVGFPLPCTVSSKYAAVTSEIDIQSEMKKSISSDIKEKRKKEKQEVEEVQNRQKQLLEESKRAQKGEEEVVDSIDEYITLAVKKAQLSWNYMEHIKKILEIRDIIKSTRNTLQEMDLKDPVLREQYMTRYMKAREESGILESSQESQTNFIQMMVEDIKLPGIDEDFQIKTTDVFEGKREHTYITKKN